MPERGGQEKEYQVWGASTVNQEKPIYSRKEKKKNHSNYIKKESRILFGGKRPEKGEGEF